MMALLGIVVVLLLVLIFGNVVLWGIAGIAIFFGVWIFQGFAHATAFLMMVAGSALVGLLVSFFRTSRFQDERTNARLKWEQRNADRILESRKRESNSTDQLHADDIPFDEEVADLFRTHGYELVALPTYSGDLYRWKAFKREENALVQLNMKPVSESIVDRFYEYMNTESLQIGFIITKSGFSNKAKAFARGKKIALVDGRTLKAMLDEAMQLRG